MCLYYETNVCLYYKIIIYYEYWRAYAYSVYNELSYHSAVYNEVLWRTVMYNEVLWRSAMNNEQFSPVYNEPCGV